MSRMSTLSEVLSAVREVMTLTHDVKKLWDKVDELGLDMRELDRRITRLEAQWDTALKFASRKKLE
jgi:hypothetical protein